VKHESIYSRIKQPPQDIDAVVQGIKSRLKEKFNLDHATVEIERGACADEETKAARA
jgi:cobalt-zinc-cadmium efflux system protein